MNPTVPAMEQALLLAYRLFMKSDRLSTDNLSITKATLSRAIIHAMERGERDESRLAMYAVNTFATYSNDRAIAPFRCRTDCLLQPASGHCSSLKTSGPPSQSPSDITTRRR